MKIDRHNYEEFFLLYNDDELTVDQRRQVELFVKENPDLRAELVMLQQSKLIPDHIVFPDKNVLMKGASGSPIHMDNYEEWLALYVDDELTEEQKSDVEKFAANHTRVRHDLALFQQAKLQAEKIVFANKEILYRTEKPRVVVMQWWRVAVAAVLIVAAGITVYSLLNTPKQTGMNRDKNELVADKHVQSPAAPKSPNQDLAPNGDKRQEQVAIAPANSDVQERQSTRNRTTTKPHDNSRPPKGQPVIAQVDNVKQAPQVTSTDKITEPRVSDVVTVQSKTPEIDFNKTTVTEKPVETLNTVEVASNTENKRFRGLFRKASRLIERTANINPTDDDNRVLIGGMAINLK